MSKKSAKSKGFRKTVSKKPYLTKKEIIIFAVIVGAVVLGLILFGLLHDDGSLKVRKGVVQTDTVNPLICNAGTNADPRYFEIGSVLEMDGYALTSELVTSDENVVRYVYTPDEAGALDSVVVTAYAAPASTYASAMSETYATATGVECGELQSTQLGSHEVSYFSYRMVPVETTDEDGEVIDYEPTYFQALHAYVDLGERCVSLQVRNYAESEADYVEDALLVDVMNEMLPAIVVPQE